MTTENQNHNVLSLEWHVQDNWYGQNYRMVLLKSDIEGFKNAREAKRFRALLVQYTNVKKTIKLNAKRVCFGLYADLKTYHYCSMGPSWSCTNIEITVDELLAWQQQYQSTQEFRDKQRKNERRKQDKEQREARKAEHRRIHSRPKTFINQ